MKRLDVTYDANGNPGKIYFTNGSVTKYKYSAAGEKLRVTNLTAVPNITVAIGSARELAPSEIQCADSTDYLLGGSLVMEDGMIDKFLFNGGYASASMTSPTTYSFSFYYYNQDHLGNNREVVDSAGTVRQITHYYPFGTPYADPSTVLGTPLQPYKYNGKELDRMHGLVTYDYGARQYAPILGRWDRMDPLCEKYYGISPYAYCGNNPVNRIDPDGRFIISKEQAKEYPKLNLYLQKGIQGILDNPKIMYALRIAGRFTNEEIKEMVTYGKGLTINVTHIVNDHYGSFDSGINSTTLNINEDIVNRLEKAEGREAEVYLFITAVSILHESAHYGDDLKGSPDGGDREDGDKFEELAYGKKVTNMDAWLMVSEYLNKLNDNK